MIRRIILFGMLTWTGCIWSRIEAGLRIVCWFSLDLTGHGNEADFPGFLHYLVPHRSLTLPFEPFRFWLRIRGDIRNRKPTPRLAFQKIEKPTRKARLTGKQFKLTPSKRSRIHFVGFTFLKSINSSSKYFSVYGGGGGGESGTWKRSIQGLKKDLNKNTLGTAGIFANIMETSPHSTQPILTSLIYIPYIKSSHFSPSPLPPPPPPHPLRPTTLPPLWPQNVRVSVVKKLDFLLV